MSAGQRPPSPRDYAGQSRRANRELRRARELLARAETFLHDLPDHQCPTGLLDEIRRFTHTAPGGNTQ